MLMKMVICIYIYIYINEQSGAKIVVVIKDVELNSLINGEKINFSELKDLNRGRSYLKAIANKYSVKVYIYI